MKFKAVISNPPYSLKWRAAKQFQTDQRFERFGVAPKAKADFAFILHGLAHLEAHGTAAFILPHGVLFRGQSEGKIRQALLDANLIDGVIGLPEKLFDVTGIPVAILILKKDKPDTTVMFVDASAEYDKGKNQNFLNDALLAKIFDAYQGRKDIDRYAHLATVDEIKANDYNLNIPRYVDTFVPEPPVDVHHLVGEMLATNAEVDQLEREIGGMLGKLVGNTPEAQVELDELKKVFDDEQRS